MATSNTKKNFEPRLEETKTSKKKSKQAIDFEKYFGDKNMSSRLSVEMFEYLQVNPQTTASMVTG